MVAPVVSGLILGASKLNIIKAEPRWEMSKKKRRHHFFKHMTLHPQKGSGEQLAGVVRPLVHIIGAFLARDIDDTIVCTSFRVRMQPINQLKKKVLCLTYGCAIELGVISVLT